MNYKKRSILKYIYYISYADVILNALSDKILLKDITIKKNNSEFYEYLSNLKNDYGNLTLIEAISNYTEYINDRHLSNIDFEIGYEGYYGGDFKNDFENEFEINLREFVINNIMIPTLDNNKRLVKRLYNIMNCNNLENDEECRKFYKSLNLSSFGKIQVGPRGGRYVIKKGKKHYLK